MLPGSGSNQGTGLQRSKVTPIVKTCGASLCLVGSGAAMWMWPHLEEAMLLSERPVEDGEGMGDAIELSLPSNTQAARVESVEGKDHASHTVQSP